MSDISSSTSSNCENKLFSSPLITLHGKPLKGMESPRTLQETLKVRNGPRRTSGRFNSPSGSPRKTPNSPKISSRLPIRSSQNLITRFSMKDVRIPLDDSITNNQSNNNKVTPEKLMEELREEVKKKQRRLRRELDEEISLSIPFTEMEELRMRPRMSLRNRCPIIVDAPDLVYEDPLEVARQTLKNTRTNTGYRNIKLIYTTERRNTTRSCSPEPAFSKNTGIRRHLLKHFEDEIEENHISEGKLKFDRILKLFEVEEDSGSVEDSEFDFIVNLDAKPMKSCLKQPASFNSDEPSVTSMKPQVIQVKRICYEGDDEDAISRKSADPPDSPTKKRRLSSGNGSAKRLKNPED